MEGLLSKKNILGRKNTQYYILEAENFQINYGSSKKKIIKSLHFSEQIQQALEEEIEFVLKHNQNGNKFIINMGVGKNGYQLKFEAPTPLERDLWVKALLLMVDTYKVSKKRSKSEMNVQF